MLEKNMKGFTLVEIIVTMVIVGVLTMIAMPVLWHQMGRQQGQEAMNNMTMMRSAMESCGVANNYDYQNNCLTWDAMNMGTPDTTKFTYSWSNLSSGTYTLTATRVGSPSDYFVMTRDATGAHCTGYGSYAGMC